MNFEEKNDKPLEKYGRDITKCAREGKIDPVIGRDEEIRSITMILSAFLMVDNLWAMMKLVLFSISLSMAF